MPTLKEIEEQAVGLTTAQQEDIKSQVASGTVDNRINKLQDFSQEPELFGSKPQTQKADKNNAVVQRGSMVQEPIKTEIETPKDSVKTGLDDTGVEDIRVTKIGEVLSKEERRDLIDKERDRIRSLEGVPFEERNEMFRKLNEDIQSGAFFGGETQLEKERQAAAEAERRISGSAKEAMSEAEALFNRQVEEETRAIESNANRVMDSTQRLNSLRGAGRSSANEEIIQRQTQEMNGLITAAKQQANLKLQQRQMEIEGAEAEAIFAVRDALLSNQKVLNERIAAAQEVQLELNNEIGADFEQSMDTMLGVLEAGGEDISGINQEKSAKLGYFVNQDGSLYLNNSGNPVEFKTTISANYTPEQIDSFAKGVAQGDLKFTDLDLDNADIALVIQAMNSKMDDTPGLSVNSIKAQRILKDIGLGTDEESVRTVTNLLKTYTEAEVKEMIATDEFKNGAFVAGNQKLFDDLRKDATSFKDIERTYSGMSEIWEDFRNNPSESRAAMEQALIIMFNKMLDPGSVVREGEFDRTSQGQSILNQAEGWLQKLSAGGAGIKNESFEDIINIAGTLYGASQDTVTDLKSSYKNFAGDLGADPEFVDRFFEQGFDLDKKFDDDIESDIGSIFGGGETKQETPSNTFQSSSGTKFVIPTNDFNSGDQTSSSKGLDVRGNTDLISKYPREAAFKNNNPTGITYGISARSKGLLDDAGVQYEKGTSRPANEGGSYYSFNTVEDGMKAYKTLLTKASYDDVYTRLKQWVGTSEGDSYASGIMSRAGISKGKKFSELNQYQLAKLMEVQLKKESPNFYNEVVASRGDLFYI